MTFRLSLVRNLEELGTDSSRGGIRPRHGALPSVADEVRKLALGMRWHPAHAEHVAQRILRAATEERSAPGEPRRVAVLRRAVRELLASEPSPFEQHRWTFDALAEDLARGRDEPLPAKAFGEHSSALVDEVRRGCFQTMLLCLDRPRRIAYLLATLDDMDDRTASAILEIPTEEFRARAADAQRLVARFTEENCGLVNRARPCRCSRRLGRALLTGRVDPDELLFAQLALPNVRAI